MANPTLCWVDFASLAKIFLSGIVEIIEIVPSCAVLHNSYGLQNRTSVKSARGMFRLPFLFFHIWRLHPELWLSILR